MSTLRVTLQAVLAGVILWLGSTEIAWPVDQLRIETNSNADLLPYSFIVEESNDWGVRKLAVGDQIKVLHVQMGSSDTAWYIHAFNSDLNYDSPAVLSLEMYSHGQIVDWNPLNLILTNFALYRDSSSGGKGIVAMGHRNDSAFAAIMMPGSDHYEFIFLATGEDHSGNDKWEAGVAPLLVEDYDYDGHDELFLWVGPGRDLEPRILICLEPDSRSIEWSLPVAGAISHPSFHSCRDSANPSVIFATYNLKNGVIDDNFDDNFCWLAKVDSKGKVLNRYIISEEHGGKGVWPGESDGLFYVFHALPMVLPEDSTKLPPQQYQLSKIDSDFHQLESVDLDDRIVSTWWDSFDPVGERCFYTLTQGGFVRIFDRSLNLLAISNKTPLHSYVDTFRLVGMDKPAYLFSTGSGMQFYSRQFEHLGTIDKSFKQVHSLVNDDQGCVTHLVATIRNANYVYSVKQHGLSDFVRLLFWKYQTHLLITLTILALALVVVNIFRQRAARRLARSERRLHEFFETSQDGFYRSDSEGRIIWVSKAVVKILGYEKLEDVIGQRIADHYANPEKRQLLLEQIQQTGKVTDYEVELLRRDGSTVIVSTSSALYRDKSGQVMGVEGVFRDITKRKLAERALKESEDLNRAVVEHSPIGVTVRSRAGKLLTYNEAWRNIWQVSDEDMLEYTTRERQELIFDKRDTYLGDWTEKVRQIYKEGGYLHIPEIETNVPSKQERLWLSQHFYALKDSSDRVDRVVILTEDITDRKQAEDALRESEERYRRLFDESIATIYLFDADENFVHSNESGLKLLGYSKEEILSLNISDVDADPNEVTPTHKQLLSGGRIVNFEHRLKRKDGRIITVLNNSIPLTDTQGNVIGFQSTLIDITDRKQAEEALREAEDARYDQAKQIAGGVSHEIYNALFPAISCLAKLGDRLIDSSPNDLERNLRLLELTESAVGRAINMTDLVTRYSRLDSEKIEEAVVLRPLLDEILESNAERISDLGVELQVTVADDVVVNCSTDHLHSVFSNLLFNALDALEEVTFKQIKIEVSREESWVKIRFIDNGSGITGEQRSRIFDPFYSTKPTRGTGLGLAIVKRILELYDGRIELEPSVDKGTIFVIFLKLVQIDHSEGDQ